MDLSGIAVDCLQSLRREVIGISAAALLGVLAGILRTSLPSWLKDSLILNFGFDIFKFIPPIAWIPFSIMYFGIGDISAAFIVFVGAFAPIFLSAYEGLERTPQIYIDSASTFEVNGLRRWYLIKLPAALPELFTGLRSGISIGWMAVIAAELVGGQSGLGYSIQLNRIYMQYDLMALNMFLIGALGYILFASTYWLEKMIIPWKV